MQQRLPVRSEIEERAHHLWQEMIRACQNANLPREHTKYGPGYFLIGTYAAFARKTWPGAKFSGRDKKALDVIRQFLKASGNAVIVEHHSQGANAHRIFVRAHWQQRDAIPVIIGINPNPDWRTENRLTPVEAGETRDPEPVTIKKAEAMSEAHAGNETDEYPDFIRRIADGKVECMRCGKHLSPRGIGGHVKKHYAEDREAQIDELAGRLADKELIADAAMNDIQPQHALEVLGLYIQNLIDQRDELQRELAEHTAKQSPSPDMEARMEMIREILTSVQSGSCSMMRALSDINDALEA